MVYVQGGVFKRGKNDEDSLDQPEHSVKLTDYYIAETEVTQELYEAVMGSNPSKFKGAQRPVEMINWYDAQEFLKKLNKLIPQGKPRLHLPTEAQWEYAARGGKQTKGYKYAGSNDSNEVAWYYDGTSRSKQETCPVKGKKANELGLFDMSGNVSEWCEDEWDIKAYKKAKIAQVDNPILINDSITTFSNKASHNKKRSEYRVMRGGSWNFDVVNCLSHNRVADLSEERPEYRGFRFAGS